VNYKKLKVLSLEPWMIWREDSFYDKEDMLECVLREISPIFNRDGYYYHEGFSWFEYSGEAYQVSSKYFIETLDLLDVPCLRIEEIKAIETLLKNKTFRTNPKLFLNNYGVYQQYLYSQRVRRNSELIFKRITKEIEMENKKCNT